MRKLIFILALAAPAAAQQTPQYQARIPGLSSTNGVASFSTPAQAAGLQDTLSEFPVKPWSCGSGGDESIQLYNCILADIGKSVVGRRYVMSTQGAATMSESPFSALSTALTYAPSFEIDINPAAVLTLSTEWDLYNNSVVDCDSAYAGGNGSNSGGAYLVGPAVTGATMFTDSAGGLATTALTQGDKIRNCGFESGASGQTAINFSWGQEGTQARNNRFWGFQIGFNRDATATDGGIFHNWGLYDNQVELNDSTDSTIWGARYGYNSLGAEVGIVENFSGIGGHNTSGNMKIGIENDSSNLSVLNATFESLNAGILNNNVHSSGKFGNYFLNIGCSSANSPMPICGEDGTASAQNFSQWEHVGGGLAANLVELGQPSATIKDLHAEPEVARYQYSNPGNFPAQAIVDSESYQAATVNKKSGDSYPNAAAWPSVDLPAKTVTVTITGITTTGTQYITSSDVSAGLMPEGLAANGDLQQQTGTTPHAMSVVRQGPGNCIFDGATTANDCAVLSSTAWNGSSAVMCHDSGVICPVATGPYIGKIGKTESGTPPAQPAELTATTNCASGCTTNYQYCYSIMANDDPTDHTTSACSPAVTVASAATLTSGSGGITNTISGFSGCSSATPCRLYGDIGGGWYYMQELISTSSVIDSGNTGATPNTGEPYSVGIIDPPVHVELGQSGAAIATSSSLGVVQPDNSTITINGSGVISTAAGSVLPYYWGQQGGNGSQNFAATANTQYAWPFLVTGQVGFKQMCIYIAAADSSTSDYYNVALVKLSSPSCTGAGCATTTLAQWGPTNITAIPTSKYLCEPNSGGGTATATPGLYYVVTTGNATTATFETGSSVQQQLTNLTSLGAGTSSSGTFGTITLSVATSGIGVITAGAGPIQFGLSQ